MRARAAYLDLGPLARATGTIALPGSKSISNRTLLLAALAHGDTTLTGVLDSDDTARMLGALTALGIAIERDGATARVRGAAGVFPVKSGDFFLGNAGTAIRPLTAVLALAGGEYRLRGVARMHERPIGDLVDGLRSLGARIEYLGNDGFPPLAIYNRPAPHPSAAGGPYQVSVRGSVSSQFLTALLLAAPLLARGLEISVDGELISKPYVEITLNLMARFGVMVDRDGWTRFSVPAGSAYRTPGTLAVEGDASAASYFLAAGAIGGGPVRVTGVGGASIQGDIGFVAPLEQMGARIAMSEDWIEARAPVAGGLHGIDIDCNHIPDAAMTLAMVALFAAGRTTLRNIGSWRVKETDRIAAMAAELAKLGATVAAGADYLSVIAPVRWKAATLDTYDDHRMAMCAALAAFGGVTVRINEPGCVGKTFPDYFERFAALTTR